MLRRVFKAFHYRDFRLMWIGACTSSIGTWMQKLAQSWLVLRPLQLVVLCWGWTRSWATFPIFLFSLVGGVVADRVDRRQLLLVSQYVQMTCAFMLAVLIVDRRGAHLAHPVPVFVVAGLAQSFGGPAYRR